MRIKAALLSALLVLLGGCAFPAKAPANEIRPTELTEREQSIVDLIGAANKDILLFEYDVSEPCNRFEAWVEVYEKGELTADWPAGLSFGAEDAKPWKGTLAVTIQTSPEFVWAFAAEQAEGGRVSQQSNPLPAAPENASSAKGKISSPVPVVIGEEIILYSAVYSTGDTMNAYVEEEYKNPEQIKKQEYLQLIKCRFSMEE